MATLMDNGDACGLLCVINGGKFSCTQALRNFSGYSLLKILVSGEESWHNTTLCTDNEFIEFWRQKANARTLEDQICEFCFLDNCIFAAHIKEYMLHLRFYVLFILLRNPLC